MQQSNDDIFITNPKFYSRFRISNTCDSVARPQDPFM